jgi:hypothetical protein
MSDPLTHYHARKAEYTAQSAIFQKRANLVGNLRLGVVVAGIASGIAAYRAHSVEMTIMAIITTIAVFMVLALYHNGIFERLERLRVLSAINGQGIDRFESRWGSFSDIGAEFVDSSNPYTSDLDIFGKNSLYQYLCCAHTFFGRKRLAELLCQGVGDPELIRSRQEAVAELAPHLDWRQMLEYHGTVSAVGSNPHPLLHWAEGTGGFFRHGWLTIAGQVLPCITGGVAAVSYFSGNGWFAALPFLALQLLWVTLTTRRVHELFETFSTYDKVLSTFGSMIDHIEGQEFRGITLTTLRHEIAGGGTLTGAGKSLKRLASIVAESEIRRSPLPWLLVNILLLWDLRCVRKLDSWKARHGKDIRRWLTGIAEFETMASLALLSHDHPSWVFPQIIDHGPLALRMQGVGHPLLDRAQAVVNDFELGPPGGSSVIITGSNMSGKSTFLRTVGCNLVLALAGAPVCAQRFECFRMRLFTSMRGADDLMSHTSTFYAELLRVKMIVDAAADAAPLLFLLDELFRGTNSTDRHDGAVTLLHELSRPHTLGIISTHDLELCSLAQSNTLFKNYHFDERYDGGELHFDYRLKDGPSTTRNAIYLMRLVGIGVHES